MMATYKNITDHTVAIYNAAEVGALKVGEIKAGETIEVSDVYVDVGAFRFGQTANGKWVVIALLEIQELYLRQVDAPVLITAPPPTPKPIEPVPAPAPAVRKRATTKPMTTRVYERPGGKGRLMGALGHGTTIEIVEQQAGWSRIQAPAAGWVDETLLDWISN